MNQIILKIATIEDLNLLQAIGKQTFREAFAAENTAENMATYLEEGFALEKLRTELADSESLFYLATQAEKTIGYLKINVGQAQSELKTADGLEIERIYVLSDFYGAKVGQILFQKALDTALQMGKSYLWLGVWEKNLRAIRFYEKNGFVTFDKHIFMLGNDAQTDLMMKRNI